MKHDHHFKKDTTVLRQTIFQVFWCMLARGTWNSHLCPELTQRSWI